MMNQKKILIVEDDRGMRIRISLALEMTGYQVFQAEDGEEGLKMAKEVKPDLILSDVVMPNMDGNELLKKLRSTDFGRNIPFIILTARGKMKAYFDLVRVDDFIEKPFETDELITKVEKSLKKRKSKSRPMSMSAGQSSEEVEDEPIIEESNISEETKGSSRGTGDGQSGAGGGFESDSMEGSDTEETQEQSETDRINKAAILWDEAKFVSEEDIPKEKKAIKKRPSAKWVIIIYGAAVALFTLIHILHQYWMRNK